MVDIDSVQSTINLADSALAAIHEKSKGNGNDSSNSNSSIDDEVISLTQSINNAIINASNSNGNDNVQVVENPFMTAKQALAKNIGQRSLGQSHSNANANANNPNNNNNSYNPAVQARKLLGAKRRMVDPKSNESGGYRDEGRDINTEFR